MGAAVGVEDHFPGQIRAQGDRPSQRGLDQVGARMILDGPSRRRGGGEVSISALGGDLAREVGVGAHDRIGAVVGEFGGLSSVSGCRAAPPDIAAATTEGDSDGIDRPRHNDPPANASAASLAEA